MKNVHLQSQLKMNDVNDLSYLEQVPVMYPTMVSTSKLQVRGVIALPTLLRV
jgi:hypothetical protein